MGLVSRPDGFTGNPKVRIGLTGKVRKAEGMLRGLGMGAQTDELLLAMNRAAEAAVPAAKSLPVDAIQQMSVIDAKDILSGGDDSATGYSRAHDITAAGRKPTSLHFSSRDRLSLIMPSAARNRSASP